MPNSHDDVIIDKGQSVLLNIPSTQYIQSLTIGQLGSTGSLLIGSTQPGTNVILDNSGNTYIAGTLTLGNTTGGGLGELETNLVSVGNTGNGATGTIDIGNPADSGNPGELAITTSLTSNLPTNLITVGSPGATGSTGTLTTGSLSTIGGLTINVNGTASVSGSLSIAGGANTIAGKLHDTDSSYGIMGGGGKITSTGEIDGNYSFPTSAGWTIDSNGSAMGNLGGGSYVVKGTLKISGTLYPQGNVTLDGGTFTDVAGGSGGLNFQHNLTVNGGSTGATFSDSLGTTILNPATFDTTGGLMTVKSAFTDDGAVTSMGVGYGGTLAIATGATFTLIDCLSAKIALAAISGGSGPPPPGTFVNGANDTMDIQSPNTAPLLITSGFSNLGTLEVDNSADSGTISNPGGGGFYNLSGTLTLYGNLTLLGPIGSTASILQQAGAGTLFIGSAITPGGLTTAQFGEYGNVEVSPSSTLTTTGALTQFSGSKLTLDPRSATSLNSFTQDGGGDLVVEASSPGTYGTLTVVGEADLSSQFELNFVGGYTPTKGTAFTVVRANPVKGTFYPVPQDVDMTYAAGTVTATYTG